MSLTVALNTAVSGLLANQEAIAATSENIANVNSTDFARREARFTTDAIPDQFSGVQVEIERAGIDSFLQNAQFSSASDAGAAQTISDALSRIEASLGAPGDNLSFANELDEAFAAFTTLNAAPSSLPARAVAVAELDGAFAAFSRTLTAIDLESTGADGRLEADVERANALLQQVFDLNQIAPNSNGAGDQITGRLRELASLIDISVTSSDNGQVSVSTTDGQLLVSASTVRTLGVSTGEITSVGFATSDGSAITSINASITGGTIGGLLQLRNSETGALRDTVANAARDIAAAINAEFAQNAPVGSLTGEGAGPLIIETPDGLFTVNPDIIADPSSLAIARPADGGVGGPNDGAGAAAIANLSSSDAARGAIEAIGEIGAAVQSANDRSAIAATFASEIETRVSNASGVNLDQELANLIQFQRSFSANARVIAAVDELYVSILNIL